MALTNSELLQNRLANLKRTPCPQVPTENKNPLQDIKLKHVNKANTLNGEREKSTEEQSSETDAPKKQRSLSVKEHAKRFDQSPIPPKQKPPPIGVKPVVATKPLVKSKNGTAPRPPSVDDKPR